MHKIKTYIWLCILFCLLFITKGQGQTLPFKNYSVNQGLASSTIYSIHQDSKGFIWLATESGVNRFDGKTFELFTIDNGLSDNEVLQIKEDSKGRIWFLTLNGKLSYYFQKKFYNTENNKLLRQSICKGSFVSFFEDSNHHLWFSTNQNKLLEIFDNQSRFHSSATPLNGAFLFENAEKKLFALSHDHFQEYRNNKFEKKIISELPISSKAIWQNPNDRSILFLSKTGLIHYNDHWVHIVSYLPEEIISNAAGKFIADKKGNLWFSTMGDGLYLLNTEKSQVESHLKENIISDILQDQQGNIWVSTIGNGLYMLPAYAQSTINYTTKDGLNSGAVHSVLKIKNQLVLGLQDGSIDLIKNGRINHTSLKSGGYNPVRELVFDSGRNSVWFASNHQFGEFKPASNSISFLKEQHHGIYAIKDFSVSKAGKIALAMASGVYLIENKNSALVFDSKQAQLNKQHIQNRAFAVFYDSAGRLWLANINGLYCQYNQVQLFQDNSQSSQRITDIAELPDGSILCSTYGHGLLVLKGLKRIKTISKQNGLPSNICKRIYTQGNTAWIVTGKGISKIDFANHEQVTNFGTENGLISSEVNSLIVENDTVYAATNNGLSIFCTKQSQQKIAAPKLYINQLLANKKAVRTDTLVSLPHLKNNITVNFIALDFEHPAGVRYSYRLNPELRWNETANNTIEFASLQTGVYHLQIRAKSLNSNWSKPIEVQFTINPPFWKTWWFIILSLLATGLSFAYLISLYYKSKRAKENERLLTQSKIISLEQQALQAMMNPHFVFNVMNSIQYFINTKENTMANQALTGFARLLRKNLENCNKSYITIEEEISYLNLYLSLEKMRFGERMSYKINVDTQINQSDTYIPSMLLQPFVENAIWHGLMPKEDNGNIWINITLIKEAVLEIEIRDDGIGIQNSLQQKTEGHISRGMQLTTERIKLLNKFKEQPIEIEVIQLEPEGTKVSIKIPFQPFTH